MENDYLKLSDIPTGEECVIVKVHGHGSFRNRIVEMGFVRGEKVAVVRNAPLHDPIEYRLMDGHISLRRSEAQLIEVVRISNEEQEGFNGTFTESEIARQIREKSRTIDIALVGNPNCGKTSFFNRATGLREKVGNYSGVTVDAKQGVFHYKGYKINLIDLPGTYSITEYTPEEIYVREYLTKHHPDLVLNVVDASCLERNLYLTTQLIDMNIRVVMALNMFDELTATGAKLDYRYLGQLLGIPVIPTTASRGIGITEVLDKIIEVFEDQAQESRHVHINYGQEIEDAIRRIKTEVTPNRSVTDELTPRYVAIKLLEDDRIMNEQLAAVPNYERIQEVARKEIQRLEKEYKEDTRSIITNAKY
ncbi:MAG: 50S ribosome-binding GTPase, partial [Odoribacter sp.]|nr:50S ribosome-binding GTPase [Odoribacter sp.]